MNNILEMLIHANSSYLFSTNCVGYNVSMVWFGTGVIGRDKDSFAAEKACLRLVAAREVIEFIE